MFMGNYAGATLSSARLPGIDRVGKEKAEKTTGGRTNGNVGRTPPGISGGKGI